MVEEAELDALVRLRDDADEERVLLARLPAEALLPDDRLAVERVLDELDRLAPPLDLPVLRRSAIDSPSLPLGCTLPATRD